MPSPRHEGIRTIDVTQDRRFTALCERIGNRRICTMCEGLTVIPLSFSPYEGSVIVFLADCPNCDPTFPGWEVWGCAN